MEISNLDDTSGPAAKYACQELYSSPVFGSNIYKQVLNNQAPILPAVPLLPPHPTQPNLITHSIKPPLHPFQPPHIPTIRRQRP